MGFIIYYLVLIVNPMGRILVRWKSFRNSLEMLCHPICNRLYIRIHRYVCTLKDMIYKIVPNAKAKQIRGCVMYTLNTLKDRLVAGPTGLFYITRPIFDVDVELNYPKVALVPSLMTIQEAINDVAMYCIQATKSISMWGATRAERESQFSEQARNVRSMHLHIAQDRLIVKQLVMLAGGVEVLKQLVSDYIQPFHRYDFLWKTDKASALEAFCLEARIPYQQIQRSIASSREDAASLSITSAKKGSFKSASANALHPTGLHPTGSSRTGLESSFQRGDKQPEQAVTPFLTISAISPPQWEGLRMGLFFKGIEFLATQTCGKHATTQLKPVLSMPILELVYGEMQKQFKVEQEVTSILPVHNIGALSIDTISLKNVLKAESRAWKMLYGQTLLAHADGLLKGMKAIVDSLSNIMHHSKNTQTSVHDMIQLVNALSDAEQFEVGY